MESNNLIRKIKEKLDKTPVLKGVLLFILIGLAYFIFIKLTGIMIPCPFKLITGLDCPGCGVTHMFLDMANLDFVSAFWDNPFLFVTWPFIVAYLIYYFHKQSKNETIKYGKYIEITFLVALCVFGIVRNIW